MKSVRTHIFGGVGNQLFCYSAGFYFAQKNGFKLELIDMPGMNSTERDSSLISTLKLPGRFVSISKWQTFKIRLLKSKLRHLTWWYKKTVFSNSVGYDANLESANTSMQLQGYFQTWKYARNAREVILCSIEQNIRLSKLAEDVIEQINSENPFILHIRLGDYRKKENAYFGILGPDYYQNILRKYNQSKRKVFVFSDEIQSARFEYAQFLPPDTVWVDEDSQMTAIETLYVMSRGSAFAIANSTFSWWAAYLSSPESLVVTPSKWFRFSVDPIDLIPIDWIREESKWSEVE